MTAAPLTTADPVARMDMTKPGRIDALVASAFNLAAVNEPSLRNLHPDGMNSEQAAALTPSVRVGWVESYLRRAHAGELKQHEPLLYSHLDAQAALDHMTGGKL